MSRKSRRQLKASSRAAAQVKPFRISGAGAPVAIAAAESAEGKPKLRRFSMMAYTGAPMDLEGFWNPVIVDLQGVKVPAQSRPILRQHDSNRIVGHSEAVKVSSDGIEASGIISGTSSDATEVIENADNGFPWQASIGANPVRMEFLQSGKTTVVNGRKVTGPMNISRETSLGEISFVPLGADGATSASIAASKTSMQGNSDMDFEQYCASLGYEAAKLDASVKAALEAGWKASQADDSSVVTAAVTPLDIKAEVAKATESLVKATRDAFTAESERVTAIQAAIAKHGVKEIEIDAADGKKAKVGLEAHAIKSGWTADQAELAALRAARPGSGVGVPGGLAYSTSQPVVDEAVLECAVIQAAGRQFCLEDDSFYLDRVGDRTNRRVDDRTQRTVQAELKSRYGDRTQQAAHSIFRGRAGLQQILTMGAAMNGYRGPEVLRDDDDITNVLRAANWDRSPNGIQASTVSLSNVLANVLNKFMLQGYLYVEQAWRMISGIRAVKDFKPTKSINLFGDFIYEQFGAGGELKNANLADQAFANQADQYGKILTIDRKTIINDDLSALTAVPMAMGRGAGLKLNSSFWTLWLDTNQKDDGASTAFWAATHTIANQSGNSNYISGASSAMSSASLKTAKYTYDKQVDPNGYPLGIDAQILLYPVELDQTAWELMNSSFIVMEGLASTAAATKQPSANRWQGRFTPVMSRYLSNSAFTGYSTTAWWMLAPPGSMPSVECCFVGGQEYPTVQQAGPDYQFNIPGISVRGIFDFGVTMQNFRAGVKSAGA